MTRALHMTVVLLPMLACAPASPPNPSAPMATRSLEDPRPIAQASPSPVAESPPTTPPPRRDCDGVIVIVRDGQTEHLTRGCHGYGPVDGPYAEVLDPSGDTRFVVEGCDSALRFDVVGWTKTLPGSLSNVRVRTGVPGQTSESTSTAARMTVSHFGAVGEIVEGTFEATMTARLNANPEVVSGTFRVCRGPDRGPP